jgi:hypothetical protein
MALARGDLFKRDSGWGGDLPICVGSPTDDLAIGFFHPTAVAATRSYSRESYTRERGGGFAGGID